MEVGPLLLVQAQTRAARDAATGGHRLGPWEGGTRYPGGERDWWARCEQCGSLVWVLATSDGHGVIQDVPGRCPPESTGPAA